MGNPAIHQKTMNLQRQQPEITMGETRFTSLLPEQYQDELESLLFFHPRQGRFAEAIDRAVAKYGLPRILKDGNYLRVCVGDYVGVQSLYAIIDRGKTNELAGALVYTVEGDTLVLLHIAVKEQYSFEGVHSDEALTIRMLLKLRDVARQIKGVASIQVFYERLTQKIFLRKGVNKAADASTYKPNYPARDRAATSS